MFNDNIVTFMFIVVLIASFLTKLPWPDDNKETFRSSSQTAYMCSTLGGGFTLNLFIERQARKLNNNFYSVRFDPAWYGTRIYRFNSRRSIHPLDHRSIYLFYKK